VAQEGPPCSRAGWLASRIGWVRVVFNLLHADLDQAQLD